MMVIHNRVEIAKHQHHTEVCHLHHSGNNNMKQQEQQEEQKQQQQKQLHHHENALPSKALDKLQKSRNKTTHTVTARLPPSIHMHVGGEESVVGRTHSSCCVAHHSRREHAGTHKPVKCGPHLRAHGTEWVSSFPGWQGAVSCHTRCRAGKKNTHSMTRKGGARHTHTWGPHGQHSMKTYSEKDS